MVDAIDFEQPGQTPEGRLVITKMIMTNFKSYAGEQVVGEFHKNFSSVVGPNGSGKSNVIDAMLFVFGFKAKKLRLNKVSELIHNSAGRQNIEKASVMVHFQRILDLEGGEFDVVPNSELVVGRVAHRNNQSDYYLDGRKRQQREVVARLLQEGIDLDNNRFLILQGEVEQISLMKPKAETEHDTGLLEYLSDIIGVSHYQQMLLEFASELEALTEERQSKVASTKRVEAQRDALIGDRDVAMAYISQQAELFHCHDRVTQNMTMLAAGAVATIESYREQVVAHKEHEDRKIGGVRSECAELASTRDQKLKAAERGQKQLDEATKAVEFSERSAAKSLEDGKANATKAKKQRATKAKLEAAQKSNEAEREELPGEVQQLRDSCAEVGERLAEAEAKLETLDEGCRGEREDIVRKQQAVAAEAAPFHEGITQAKARQSEPAAERDLLCQHQTAATRRYEEAQESARQAEVMASERQQAVKGFKADLERHTKEGAKQQARETAARNRAEETGGQLRDIQGKLAHSRHAVQSEHSRGVVERALAEAVKTGRIRGKVYGALGKLGCIAKEYDYAVSSACGALENIVVDTAATARACVGLLREQGLGVATFLILESQERLQTQVPASPPEGCERLFDLVKCAEPKLLKAFFYAMSNTLVAKDMDQASRIAYAPGSQWRRVVTVKGDLIAPDGTITGGGGRPRSGRMKLGTTPPSGAALGGPSANGGGADGEEAATLESSLSQLQQDAAAANKEVADAASAVKVAQRAAAEADTNAQKAAMEAAAAAATAEDLRAQLPALKEAAKMTKHAQTQLAILEKAIEKEEADVVRLTAAAGELTSRATQLEEALADVGGPKMRKQREAVQKLQTELAAAEEEATRKQVALAAAEKSSAKIARDVASATKELAATDLRERKRAESHAQAQEVAFKLQSRLEDATEEVTRLQGELSEAEAIQGRKQAEVAVVAAKQEEFAEKLVEQEQALKQETSNLKQWREKLQTNRAKFRSDHPDGGEPQDLDEEAVAKVDVRAERARITVLEDSLSQSAPDLTAIDRHKERCAEYDQKVAHLEEATAVREQKRHQLETTRKERLDRFMAGFNTVSMNLKEMYQMITLGGDAELELVDSLDPFAEGIIFSVRPPKKSWRNIANLSGGEKTLSSLSLVFALHHYRPTPLYVMDEIDAALDFKNVSIVAHYIKERTRNAQFIIISLRSNMFELADRLVGIYKTDNATKSVAIDPEAFQLATPSPEAALDSHVGSDDVAVAAPATVPIAV